ncbi:hypothetical protein P154DRAFT_520458 [Amniculicola lignicola CBS 123094]|uniref:Uncharacterized protein n=1 Tax=Amniculicola lignicola CBS 123094 TaxID=1392246 RepID=A0A6A5WVK9_9PLEO|nr:hypothetical protein P154DRAFT_520458 [Amniculicola lignicola CBS 123094]
MVSAVDIITYIGIPLAVLGVLPTIYTCLKSYLTLRQITKTLRLNGVVAITRSALLSGIVEIEIPRRSIIPLDRHDPRYFGMRREEQKSGLKGGSWTIFEWKEMVIGVKSYRLQYHDELAQPQAEIDFEALVAFLLDRGAVPDQSGWADLRNSGLWTPVGTRLLCAPVSGDEVLSVRGSDDSDGILSLGVSWRKEWDRRGWESLPPYWTRVGPPLRKEWDVIRGLEEMEASPMGEDSTTASTRKSEGAFLDDDSAASEKNSVSRSPVRVRISATGVQEAFREDDAKRKLTLPHLRSGPPSSIPSNDATAGFWFCCGSTAFEAPQNGLWSFSIPADIIALARRETVPCGIVVLLGIMTDDQVPAWRTPSSAQAEQFEKHVKFMDQNRKMQEEMKLPPDQREAARRKRLAVDAADFHNEIRRKALRDEARKEQEIVEAMQSQKLPIDMIATSNLQFLIRTFSLAPEITVTQVVEQVLYGMIADASFANRLAVMLDLWKSWGQSGGMTKGHYLAVREEKIIFALASCVLWMVRRTVSEPMGSVVGDMGDCLRVWKKVRLG